MTALPFEYEGRYCCPVCPRRFVTLQGKRTHIKHEHPKPKTDG